MDRYLYLKNANTEQMAEELCDIVQAVELKGELPEDVCNLCPATDYCRQGHNGFIEWLKEDHNEMRT